jgi:RNA polymerase sigma-70 factor (ECF subfamily)
MPDGSICSQAFLAAATPDLVIACDLERELADALSRAHAAWPALGLTATAFLTALGERFLAPEVTAEALARYHAGDLFLATACALEVPGAVPHFEAAYASHIATIIGRFQQPTTFRDEVHQLVRHRLFVARGARRPGIFEYAAKGELLAFVRVITVRIALDLLRAQQAAGEVQDDQLEQLPAAEDDPELRYLRLLYRGEFKQAFETAVRALPDRARTLLGYHLVDKLSIDKIAVIYDLHRSTVARQLERAKLDLIATTRAELKQRLQIDTSSFESVVRLIEGSVELSVERILRAAQPEP